MDANYDQDAEIQLLRKQIEEAKRETAKAEQDKVKAEQDKIKAEQDKIIAEQDRKKAEQDKIKAEQDRMKAEQDKIKAEQDRMKAEQDKMKAEQDKIKAEQNLEKSEQAMAKEKEIAEQALAKEKEKAEQAMAKAKQDTTEIERQRNTLQTQIEASTFHHLLQLAEDELFGRFFVEPDSSLRTSKAQTKVDGKWCPSRLRQWTGFADLHLAKFRDLEATFGDKRLFPSIHQMEYASRQMSPDGLKNEEDLRSFVRTAVESPAKEVLQQYFRHSAHPRVRRITFRSAAVGLQMPEVAEEMEEEEGPPKKKRRSAERPDALPDRWGVRVDHEGGSTNCFVGECKAAHKLTAATLQSVLGEHPGDDFFKQVLLRKALRLQARQATPDRSSSPSGIAGEVMVAMVLCQAFHYMIQSGLLFGYIASGEALVFLHVAESDPETLFYFPVLFRTTRDSPPRSREQMAISYLSTFCMLAAEVDRQSAQWTKHVTADMATWPISTKQPKKSLLSQVMLPGCDDSSRQQKDDESGDGGGDGSGGNGGGSDGTNQRSQTLPRGRSPTKRTLTSRESHGPNASSRPVWKACIRPPTLPFCTQACLAGLCKGTAMDKDCPNVALHAGAAAGAWPGGLHPLTVAQVRERIGLQIDRNADDNCECWDQRGYYGATAVMFKLTLSGHGYTFVAKGVQAAHQSKLAYEAAVYDGLKALQGTAVPVCMGMVHLEEMYPLSSLAVITDLLLLSWAGPSLRQYVAEPQLTQEVERTREELDNAGMYDEDYRQANLAWNEEQKRVMRIDLGEAELFEPGPAVVSGIKRPRADEWYGPKRRKMN